MNTNRLIVLAEPIFSLMSRLILSPENFSEDFRARIEHEFSEFKAQGLTLGLTMQKIENSLYALSAYVDELVLVSTWADRKVWMGQSLQAFYFKEHLAGEKFFERLAILRQQGENEADVLSLYYLCLQLGFQGKYRLLGSEQLHAYLVDFKAQLERYQKKFHLSHKQEVNFLSLKTIGLKRFLIGL